MVRSSTGALVGCHVSSSQSIVCITMQIVTAVSLVAALYRPLRRGSLFPGWKVDVRWRLPSPQAVFTFVGYAGPICGVLFTKVLIYGARLPSMSLQAQHD